MRKGRIRAAVLKWFGVMGQDYIEDGRAAPSEAGVTVTQDSMLRLSAVWACTRLISETIATLPLSMYEKTSSGKRVAGDHPVHGIIHDFPTSEATASVYWESVVAAMLLRGAARSERLMVGGRLTGLRFLAPDRLRRIKTGRRAVWRYVGDDGETRTIPDDRVWTIPGFSLDGREGVSVVRYGAEVFGAATAADTAASGVFRRGLLPTTALSYPKVLKPSQREEARKTLEVLSGAVNSGKPVILEAETTLQSVGIKPSDAQLLESRSFSVEEICRWFRVPPSMIGHAEKSSNWGTGIEQQMIGFLTFTLGPWLRRIEQSIRKDLLSPAERMRYYPKFSVEGLLRADSAGRSAFYSAMVNNGIFTRDEVRELEDREPMGGNAAVLTVHTAMAPLDGLGADPAADQARAALSNFLREE